MSVNLRVPLWRCQSTFSLLRLCDADTHGPSLYMCDGLYEEVDFAWCARCSGALRRFASRSIQKRCTSGLDDDLHNMVYLSPSPCRILSICSCSCIRGWHSVVKFCSRVNYCLCVGTSIFRILATGFGRHFE